MRNLCKDINRRFNTKQKIRDNPGSKIVELSALETETDKLKKNNLAKHYSRLSTNACDATHSPYYVSIITRLERVGDHLVNVGYSVVNPTGSQA